MIRSRNDSERLLVVLKRHLKSHGWTGARLAKELSIGEATVKRWLGGKSVTIDRLSRLAGLCEMSLADLVREAERPASGLAQELTLAQERALMADEFLALMFVTILAGYPPEETATDFALPPRLIESALSRLERLALIARRAGPLTRRRDNHLEQGSDADPVRTTDESSVRHDGLLGDRECLRLGNGQAISSGGSNARRIDRGVSTQGSGIGAS